MDQVLKDANAGEEKILLNNIMSLVQQLLSNESAEGTQNEDGQSGIEQGGTELEAPGDIKMTKSVKKGEKQMNEEDKKDDEKDEEVKKSTISTPADNDDTARDDAEKRIDDESTNITDEAIDEVAKAIAKKLFKSKEVKKSENNLTTNQLLNEIVKVQKSLLARQEETENALSNMIKGLGIADEINKSYEVQKSQEVKKGLNNKSDVEATLNYLIEKGVIKSNQEVEKDYTSNIDKVRKTLGNSSLLSALTVRK
jgi:hypothetical protein